MSDRIGGVIQTKLAAADLSSSQGLAALVDANGKFNVSGAGLAIAGVILDTTPPATSGSMCQVQSGGIAYVTTGAAVTLMAEVEVDAANKFIDQSAGIAVGVALQSSAGADETIEVHLY